MPNLGKSMFNCGTAFVFNMTQDPGPHAIRNRYPAGAVFFGEAKYATSRRTRKA